MASSPTQITKVLQDLEHEAADSANAKMFLSALPHMFGGARHDFQLRLSTMLRETLTQARDKLVAKKSSTTTLLEETKGTMETLQQEKTVADTLVETAKTILEEADAELTERQRKTKTATQEHKNTVDDNKFVEKEHSELAESKNEIDAIINGSLKLLVSGNWDNEEARDDFVKPVIDYLQEMGCDKVLLAALPKSFALSLEKRGDFAKAAVDEAVKRLNDKAASIGAALEDSKTKFEEAKAENLGAWAIADVAQDEEKVALEAKNVAEKNLSGATVDAKGALSKVMDIQLNIDGITEDLNGIDAKILECESALKEMDQLESEIVEADKENVAMASPAAKRMKLSEAEPPAAIQEEIAPAIAVQ